MPVRIIGQHNGDELDKDVSLAIRYAVDNGAKIINMSFRKGLSPDKQMVDDAVKYAEEKGVLLIKASGNESENTDSITLYPTAYFKSSGLKANNFITIGASSGRYDSTLAGDFSNYGRITVDVFAPGADIYSSLPGNKYKSGFGTSFAAPVVSGIAALIWGYYPNFNYKQVKYCIEKSATPIELLVFKPGTKEKVPFSSLCRMGGIVNAYKALVIAEQLSGGK